MERKKRGAAQHPLFTTSASAALRPMDDAYLCANASTEGKRSRFSEYVMRGHMGAPNMANNIQCGVHKSRYHKKLDGILGVYIPS